MEAVKAEAGYIEDWMDAKRKPSSVESTAFGVTELTKDHMFNSVKMILIVAACLSWDIEEMLFVLS